MTPNDRRQVPLLRFFRHDHLQGEERTVAARFTTLANMLADDLPTGSEKATALRKLMESRDAALRAVSDREQAD